MKKILFFAIIFAIYKANAANFQLLKENGQTTVVCRMDHANKIKLFRAIGVRYGDQIPTGIFLKNAEPGTEVLEYGDKITMASPNLQINKYQPFWLPQDQYDLTMERPDGSTLSFSFIRYDGVPCVLDWSELENALKK